MKPERILNTMGIAYRVWYLSVQYITAILQKQIMLLLRVTEPQMSVNFYHEHEY
jgi:hypothetical protein